jgi:hypothetical protein
MGNIGLRLGSGKFSLLHLATAINPMVMLIEVCSGVSRNVHRRALKCDP